MLFFFFLICFLRTGFLCLRTLSSLSLSLENAVSNVWFAVFPPVVKGNFGAKHICVPTFLSALRQDFLETKIESGQQDISSTKDAGFPA